MSYMKEKSIESDNFEIEKVELIDEGSLDTVIAYGTTVIRYISPIGELFMRLIKMVIVPLVFSSLLVGVAGLGDIRKLGRLGSRTLGLYLMTTAGAVLRTTGADWSGKMPGNTGMLPVLSDMAFANSVIAVCALVIE